MKEKIKTFLCICLLLVALPYIITMLFQGTDPEEPAGLSLLEKLADQGAGGDKGKKVTPDEPDVEEALAGIVAKEMPVSYEMEALKAQAVVARTNFLDALDKGEKPPESLTQDELMELWGREGFQRNYQRLAEAVNQTEGVVMTSKDGYIYAAYHAVSAGQTRNAKESLGYESTPWLESVESSADIPSPDFLKVMFWKPEEMANRLKESFPEAELSTEEPLSSIVIAGRDKADYVTQVKMGEAEATGEEFREALGLNSACFYLADVEGKIRIVTKGLGHGLGLSQYGANEMAKEGKEFREILNYYYKNIEISD